MQLFFFYFKSFFCLIPQLINPSHHETIWMRRTIQASLPPQFNGNLAFSPGTPLILYATFFYQRPNSHFVNGDRDRKRVMKKYQCEMHNRPDADNCVKCVMDSPMEGIIYKEDCTIVKAVIEKHWND